MLIIRKLRMRWNGRRFVEISSDSYGYHGKLAYAKGGTTQEIVPTGPWEGQVPYLNQLFSSAQDLLNKGPPQYPSGPTVATNPTLTQNQNDIMSTVSGNQPALQDAMARLPMNTANPVSNAAAQTTPDLTSGILKLIGGGNTAALNFGQSNAGLAQAGLSGAINASSGVNTGGAPVNSTGNLDIAPTLQAQLQGGSLNPFLDQIVQGATRGINRQFTQQTIPGIRDAAMAAGQRGGASEGIARGMAAQNLQDNTGDIIGRLFGGAFDTGAQLQQGAVNTIAGAQQGNQSAQLQTAGLNQSGANLGLNAANSILNTLMGGSQAANSATSTGTAQAGDLLSTGSAQGMQQLFQSLGLLPQLQNAGLSQLGVGNQVGLQQLGQNQSQIDSDISKFFYNQYAPYANLAQFQNFITGNYGGSVSHP